MHHAHGIRHVTRKKKRDTFDNIMYVAAIGGSLSIVPQISQIFLLHSSAGVSIMTWVTFEILTALWLVYGYKHKESPILVSGVISFVLQGVVLVGIAMYH